MTGTSPSGRPTNTTPRGRPARVLTVKRNTVKIAYVTPTDTTYSLAELAELGDATIRTTATTSARACSPRRSRRDRNSLHGRPRGSAPPDPRAPARASPARRDPVPARATRRRPGAGPHRGRPLDHRAARHRVRLHPVGPRGYGSEGVSLPLAQPQWIESAPARPSPTSPSPGSPRRLSHANLLRKSAIPQDPGPNPDPGAAREPSTSSFALTLSDSPALDRSQWDRISLAPDVELHIRRPLSRLQNRRVERLLAVARDILEEDQP